MKKLLFLVVLVAIGVPLAIGFFGGRLLGKGVETGGTYAFGTETRVGGASLNLIGGSVGLADLRVKNPAGFTAEHAFEVADIAVDTDVGSLLSDTIRIEEIRIDQPVITLEMNASGTNLGALMDHLEKIAGKEPKPDEPAPEGAGKKMHVGRLTIDRAKVKLVQSVLLKAGADIELPELTLEEVGNDVSMAELLEKILGLIMTAVAEAEIQGDLKDLLDGKIPADLKGELDGAVSKVKKELDKLGEALGDGLGEGVGDAVKEGLGGLLGGKKDDG